MLQAMMADCIRRHGLLQPGRTVIVALSGGADSVALLQALVSEGYECMAAHCNFHLRGEESMRDAAHCADICRRIGVDLCMRDFDVPARMRLTGESVEMACRSLRYEWFDSLLDRERAQAIAVGHHREDNVETFMLNLLRGTGPQGLCGMRVRNGYVVRPLLECSRAQIEAFLHERGLGFVIDSTNASNDFKRNRLRNVVIPMLDEQFDGASEAIERSMAHVADSMALYRELVEERAEHYRQGSDILLADMARNETNARMLLYEMLHNSEGFSMSAVADMLRRPDGSGRRFVSGCGHVRELHRGVLSAVSPQPLRQECDCYSADLRRDILTPLHITVERLHISSFSPERNPAVMYLDAAILDATPAPQLRRWRRGDRIEPYGMKGSRLVSDLFSDAGYSAEQKRNAFLLCRADKVLWVCGLRASRHFAVGPGTKEYLRLEIKKHNIT